MSYTIIDVREPNEYRSGHVKGAINIPLGQITPSTPLLNELSKNSEIILYCRSGNRSNVAMQILRRLGYANLTNGINQLHVEFKFKL